MTDYIYKLNVIPFPFSANKILYYDGHIKDLINNPSFRFAFDPHTN